MQNSTYKMGGWEVRTRSQHSYDLIVHKEDEDAKRVVLLTGLHGKYTIWGWILAKDGKRKEWWKDPTGKNRWAYFIPHKALKPLPRPVRGEGE